MLSGGDDNIIRLWDIEKDKQVKSYEGHGKPVGIVRALADRERFVSVSSEGKVIVWELESGKQVKAWTIGDLPPVEQRKKK